jgi:hypothetical protein
LRDEVIDESWNDGELFRGKIGMVDGDDAWKRFVPCIGDTATNAFALVARARQPKRYTILLELAWYAPDNDGDELAIVTVDCFKI